MIDVAALSSRIGEEVGVSGWTTLDQSRIDRFAEATGDAQWIHCDPARAAAAPWQGMTGTIAHGFLTLSLVSTLLEEVVPLSGARLAINYGLDRVRFPSAVPAGSRVRARVAPLAIQDAADHVQVTWRITVEREHGDKPCCVADWLVRYYRD